MLAVAAFGAVAPGGAGATKPDDEGEHKVWICHVVEGQGELKNGYNLILVDEAAIETEGHLNHVSNDGLRRDIIPAPYGELSQCIMPDMPEKAPVTTEWAGPGPDCNIQKVDQTRKVTTYSYVFDPVAWEYVEEVTTATETRTLELTDDEKAACIQQESQPPVVQPPAVQTPQAAVPATPAPAPAGAVVAAAPAATPTALPTTGGETWTIVLVGLATLLAGAGLVKLSRHTA